jgi:hypothetical protein
MSQSDDKSIQLILHASDDTVWALAQFVKRATWEHFRACAKDDDEAYAIRDGIAKLSTALAEKGFAPR